MWRRAAVALGAQLIEDLKVGIDNPGMYIRVGEIRDWTNRLSRWCAMDGRSLVSVYRDWREHDPAFSGAMVRAAARYTKAEARALRAYVFKITREAA